VPINPYILKYLISPLLIVFLTFLIIPSIFILNIIIETKFFTVHESDFTRIILDWLVNGAHLPRDVVELLLKIVPAILVPIFFGKEQQLSISTTGKICIAIMIVGTITCFLSLIAINPDDSNQYGAIEAGKKGLQAVLDETKLALGLIITYICVLTGIKIGTTDNQSR
jgi:hypothetical protein